MGSKRISSRIKHSKEKGASLKLRILLHHATESFHQNLQTITRQYYWLGLAFKFECNYILSLWIFKKIIVSSNRKNASILCRLFLKCTNIHTFLCLVLSTSLLPSLLNHKKGVPPVSWKGSSWLLQKSLGLSAPWQTQQVSYTIKTCFIVNDFTEIHYKE